MFGDLGKKLCVCIYIYIYTRVYVYMNCNLVNPHELFTCAVPCIQALVDNTMRNVFRGRGKWVKFC